MTTTPAATCALRAWRASAAAATGCSCTSAQAPAARQRRARRHREDRRLLPAARPARAGRRDRLCRLLPSGRSSSTWSPPTACGSATATSGPTPSTSSCRPCSARANCTTASCSAATTTPTTCTEACGRWPRRRSSRGETKSHARQLRRHRSGQPGRGPGGRRLRAAARALATMTPAEVCEEVLASGLRGRGGAGFPTG